MWFIFLTSPNYCKLFNLKDLIELRPCQEFCGTGEQGHLFQENRGTKAKFSGEQRIYWGTGNILNKFSIFGEQGNKPRAPELAWQISHSTKTPSLIESDKCKIEMLLKLDFNFICEVILYWAKKQTPHAFLHAFQQKNTLFRYRQVYLLCEDIRLPDALIRC